MCSDVALDESVPSLSSKHSIGSGHNGGGGAKWEGSLAQLKDFLS